MSTKKQIKDVIRQLFKDAGVGLQAVYLFGSRVRGTSIQESDWDVFVLTKDQISFKEKKYLSGEIQRILAVSGISVDILIRSASQFSKLKDCIGSISYTVARQGVAL